MFMERFAFFLKPVFLKLCFYEGLLTALLIVILILIEGLFYEKRRFLFLQATVSVRVISRRMVHDHDPISQN